MCERISIAAPLIITKPGRGCGDSTPTIKIAPGDSGTADQRVNGLLNGSTGCESIAR